MLVATVQNEERFFSYQFITELDDELVAEMRNKFQQYHRMGVILTENFESSVWKLTDERKNYFFDFSKIEKEYQFVVRQVLGVKPKQMQVACKTYIMVLLGTQALHTIRRTMSALYRLLDSLLEHDLVTALSQLQPIYLAWLSDLFQLFDSDSETIGYIQDVLDSVEVPAPTKRRRQLAPFLSYFRFSDVLDTYWETVSEQEYVTWFPLWMWWHLTTILPLRPTEFVLTPRECVAYDEKGQARLTVRRTKMKKQKEIYTYRIAFDYSTHTYAIPIQLADAIEKYCKLTEDYPESLTGCLFRSKNETFFNYNKLAGLLSDFFRLVMPDYYTVVSHGGSLENDEICKINLGDTRHIAMISLILQGGNPIVCQELAGHEDIAMSYHYYGNMSELVNCMTYELYRKKTRKTDGTQTLPCRRPLYGESVEIEGGRCYSPRYVENKCVDDCLDHWATGGMLGDCRTCKFFRSRDTGFRMNDLQQVQANELDRCYDYLKLVIEQVCRQKIDPSDIDRALMRLNHSAKQYSATLQEGYQWEDQQNTPTTN